jgi:xanthine dehydrogenase molybdenum-binding subunit
VLVQIAAATLGVDIKQCRAIFADTSVTPRSAMTSGSGMTFSAGLAAQQAAEQLREALVEAAARELEASPADVELRGDRLQVRGAATESISLADLAARLGDARPTRHVAVRPGSSTHIINSFAAHFAEVDIDTETGALKVVRYVAAHDSGAIVNPLLARGQVEGALAQALGFALMERLPIDPDTGAPLASNLGDFRIPTTMDLPPVEVIFVDSAEPNGPFGAKALGEVPMLAPAPALANAIKDAIGVRVHELPIQAQDILNAFKIS